MEGLKILELGCGLPFLSAALVALGAQVCRGFLLVEGKGAMKFSGTKVIRYGCLVGSEYECMYVYIYIYYRLYGISHSFLQSIMLHHAALFYSTLLRMII